MARTIFAGGSVNYDEGQVRIMLTGVDGEVSQDIRRRARAVQKRAQRRAPMRTGELRGSISVNTRYPPTGAVATITASAGHAGIIEFGRKEVKPVNKKWLHWQGDFTSVFALSSPAVAEVPFMRDALDAVHD